MSEQTEITGMQQQPSPVGKSFTEGEDVWVVVLTDLTEMLMYVQSSMDLFGEGEAGVRSLL